MKVELRHIKAGTVTGYVAIYIVRLSNGQIMSFGGDYKAAYRFVQEAA